MSWIFLALLVPLIYAIITLIDDNLLSYVYRSPRVGASISGLFGILPAIILVATVDVGNVPTKLIMLAIFTGMLSVFAIYFYFVGLSKASPSVVSALMSLSPAIIPFLAYFVVGERLGLQAILGFSIVIVATICYSMVEMGEFRLSKALIPVLVAGLSLDFVAVINKYIYTNTGFLSAYFYYSIGLVIAGIVLMSLFNQGDKRTLATIFQRRYILLVLLLVIVELMSLIASFTFNKALSLGPVSLVSAIENIQPIFVLLITLIFFRLAPHFFLEAKSPGVKTKALLALAMIFGVYIAVSG